MVICATYHLRTCVILGATALMVGFPRMYGTTTALFSIAIKRFITANFPYNTELGVKVVSTKTRLLKHVHRGF